MAAMTLAKDPGELAEAIRRAQDEPLFVEADGRPVAVVLSVQEYDRLTASPDLLAANQAYWDQQVALMEDLPAEVELTEAMWRELTTGPVRPISPDSLAVPPGWKPGRG
ncbi:MAG TPA: type II toxin-antitoxin system prevent-host-death family antitoxin [Thermoanaerobaculia bacterium]|nr:type II toxin-antitoxin system prevent-host-death family antitoxin [Thermoanaerobaculia bacterium]